MSTSPYHHSPTHHLALTLSSSLSRFQRATAPSLIKHFRDCIKDAPRELYANVLLTAGPADKDSLVVIQICYVGPKAKGVEFFEVPTGMHLYTDIEALCAKEVC